MSSAREINLLPLRFRQRVATRRILTAWCGIAAAMAVVCGIHISLVYNRHQTHSAQVALLRETSQPVLSLIDRRELLSERHQKLIGVRHRVDALIPSDDLLQTLGAIAAATVEPGIAGARLQTLRIDLTGATSVGPRSDKKKTAAATHVAFTAIARDELSLSQLISRLRANGRFHDVRLRGTAEHDAAGGRRAEVEAEVWVEKELPR